MLVWCCVLKELVLTKVRETAVRANKYSIDSLLQIPIPGDDHTVLLRTDRRVILTWILYVASLVPALMNINTG